MPLYPIDNSMRKNALVHGALDLLQTVAHKHELAVSDTRSYAFRRDREGKIRTAVFFFYRPRGSLCFNGRRFEGAGYTRLCYVAKTRPKVNYRLTTNQGQLFSQIFQTSTNEYRRFINETSAIRVFALIDRKRLLGTPETFVYISISESSLRSSRNR